MKMFIGLFIACIVSMLCGCEEGSDYPESCYGQINNIAKQDIALDGVQNSCIEPDASCHFASGPELGSGAYCVTIRISSDSPEIDYNGGTSTAVSVVVRSQLGSIVAQAMNFVGSRNNHRSFSFDGGKQPEVRLEFYFQDGTPSDNKGSISFTAGVEEWQRCPDETEDPVSFWGGSCPPL